MKTQLKLETMATLFVGALHQNIATTDDWNVSSKMDVTDDSIVVPLVSEYSHFYVTFTVKFVVNEHGFFNARVSHYSLSAHNVASIKMLEDLLELFDFFLLKSSSVVDYHNQIAG